MASSMINLAAVLQARGRTGEAERLYRGALTIYVKLVGREHSDVSDVLNNLAMPPQALGSRGTCRADVSRIARDSAQRCWETITPGWRGA